MFSQLRLLAIGVAVGLGLLACSGGGSGGGGARTCYKTFKVGFVSDPVRLADRSIDAAAWRGVSDAQADPNVCVQGRALRASDPADYGKNMQRLADEGYDFVVAIGEGMATEALAFAKTNPRVSVTIVDFVPDQPAINVSGLAFREDQAGFLAGALAGLFTKSGIIGGVYGPESSPINRFRAGYEAGAKYTNRKVKTLGVNQPAGATALRDPEWGKARALELAGQGADVIVGAGGETGKGALLGVQQANGACIGYEVDQYRYFPDAKSCLLSSAEKRLAVAVQQSISAAARGQFRSGVVSFDAGNGGVGLAPFHNFDSRINEDTRSKLDEIRRGLASGTIQTGVAT